MSGSPIIYKSSYAPVEIAESSVFTHLFSPSPSNPNLLGGIDGSVPAFIDAATGTVLTRAHLKKLALSFAYGIRQHPHVPLKRGSTVLLYSPNSLAWPVVLYGAGAAGLRITLANSAYTPHELAYQYGDSGASLVLTTEDGLKTVFQMFSDQGVNQSDAAKRIVVIGESLKWAGGPDVAPKAGKELVRLETLLSAGSLKEEEKFTGSDVNSTIYLCYSSGTTGKPKGVETTHRNITTLVDIVDAAYPPTTHTQDSLLGILPFYHIYGAVKLLHFPLRRGLPVVIMTRFEPVQFCQNIERYKITSAMVVPPVLVVLARHPAAQKYNLSTLNVMLSGAAPLGASLVKQVIERLLSFRKPGSSGLDIVQGYGLTETSPTTHILPAAASKRKVGSIGLLLGNLEARLVDEADVDVKEGERGELWIKGPTVMKGYLNNIPATKNAITPDGWFKTGDVAIRDAEGFYYIVDRRKELIKYKGFQVPPAELESVLLTHPDIADAAVIGIDSIKEATELPRAYVVHADPTKVASASDKAKFGEHVAEWITGKVAKHKFLRGGVVVIDVVPKSAAGKILRRELRERAKTELASEDSDHSKVKAKL